MLKNQAILEVKKDERIYQLTLANDAPLGECFDVLSQMMAYILHRMNEVKKLSDEQQEKVCEDAKPE